MSTQIAIPSMGIGRILAIVGLVVTLVLVFTKGFTPELGLLMLAFLALLIP